MKANDTSVFNKRMEYNRGGLQAQFIVLAILANLSNQHIAIRAGVYKYNLYKNI